MTPLENVKVFSLGTRWAGRVAAMLLADQGAEVIEIACPGTITRADDALLGRGKRLVELDLKKAADSKHALALATKADIVLEKYAARLRRAAGPRPCTRM